MKALVFSDSHRYISFMESAVRANPDASLIIHAGDMARDTEELHCIFPQIELETVAGNNEFFCMLPYDRVFDFGGKKIFLTHGHRYGVKSGMYRIRERTEELGADICIFGHTHVQHLSQSGGIYFLNPGAAYDRYAVINIKDGNTNIELF